MARICGSESRNSSPLTFKPVDSSEPVTALAALTEVFPLDEITKIYINRQEQSGRLGNQKPGSEALGVGEPLVQVSQNLTAYV